jgi:hypothetical protein
VGIILTVAPKVNKMRPRRKKKSTKTEKKTWGGENFSMRDKTTELWAYLLQRKKQYLSNVRIEWGVRFAGQNIVGEVYFCQAALTLMTS